MTGSVTILKTYSILLVPFAGLLLGWKFDRMETERMTLFRDKSKLYGRRLPPGDPPSWP